MSLSMLAALSVVSCNREDLVDPDGTGNAMMNVTIRLTATDSPATGYEAGTDYENYIDLSGKDYRIYFFTNKVSGGNDTFIAEFSSSSFVADETETYKTYSMLGTVPKALTFYDTFKIVILANWGTGNYPTLDSSSTIADVCEPAGCGTYSCTDGFTPGATSLIPFYGVQEYENVSFEENKTTTLTNPVNLLRAMAKIEVILQKETSDLDLAGVSL
ncbi:MAG: hypothetical protein LUD51_05495, partial [Clostridia bacterium]|nr:hypothetical protein [Clostridia bacterium]